MPYMVGTPGGDDACGRRRLPSAGLWFGEPRGLRKRVLESFRLQDTIRTIDSECYCPDGEPKDAVDQDGDPRLIGIADLARPDYGDAVRIQETEIPLFRACGVTPQVALAAARVPLAITRSPGCMLVTHLRNSQLAVL